MSEPKSEKIAFQPAPVICIGLLISGFWTTWLFYVERILDGSDEPFGILAFVFFVYSLIKYTDIRKPEEEKQTFLFKALTFIFLVLYLVSYLTVSKLLSALLAVSCLVSAISWLITPLNLSQCVLAYLSLPLIASINFYLGYPLRLVVAKISSMMLALGGVYAKNQGTLLSFNDQLVYVDAPCGGVKLMWFSLFTTAAICIFLKVKGKKALLLFFTSIILSTIANSLRVTSLFYLETGLVKVKLPLDQVHQIIGLIVQALLLVLIMFAIVKVKKLKTSGNSQVERQNGIIASPSVSLKSKTNYSFGLLCLLSLIAIFQPFLSSPVSTRKSTQKVKMAEINWPKSLNGIQLKEVSIPEKQSRFISKFPGEIKFFKHRNKLIMLRLIIKPTRKVHPASDCYKGAGYSIKWQPIEINNSGERWGNFLANKDGVSISVKERIVDDKQNQWTDASSWYWAAVLGETKPPWWGITIEEGGPTD